MRGGWSYMCEQIPQYVPTINVQNKRKFNLSAFNRFKKCIIDF